MTLCPVCGSSDTDRVVQRHSIEEATEHFAPARRSRSRHDEVRRELVQLWEGSDVVVIRICARCQFGFAVPFVAGSANFYNLLSDGHPHYPRDRWEFGRTMQALQAVPGRLRVLEIGAGDGAFLRQLKGRPDGSRFSLTALEYNEGALGRLRAQGIQATGASVTDLADNEALRGSFDAVCMFQTIEHLDRIHEVFAALSKLMSSDGHVYVSAPCAASVEVEESAAGYSEMAPQHVGRWTRPAFDVMASAHGLKIIEYALEPTWSRLRQAWLLAIYRAAVESSKGGTLEERVQGLEFRLLRGLLKRLLAVRWLPNMWVIAAPVPPHNQWVHLQPASK